MGEHTTTGSFVQEDYLKAIYKLHEGDRHWVSTGALSQYFCTTPPTVSDMLQRLERKKYVIYEKYHGVSLSKKGTERALHVIRKHRLWEVFLYDKLRFSWEAVHNIAEQLEHVQAPELTKRLADYLGNPVTDPHGDPIPNAAGEIPAIDRVPLASLSVGSRAKLVAVVDGSPDFFAYMEKLPLRLGHRMEVLVRESFDNSLTIRLEDNKEHHLSEKVCHHLFVVADVPLPPAISS